MIDVTRHAFSWPRIYNRFKSAKGYIPKWLNFVRAVSSEGFGRIKYYSKVRQLLEKDRQFRSYFEQETTVLPKFYMDQVKVSLGPLFEWLPEGALFHDPNAYLKSEEELAVRKRA